MIARFVMYIQVMLHSMLKSQPKYKELFGKQSSFVNSKLFLIPNRSFLPAGLVQTSCEGKNLHLIGCKNQQVIGGSIGFTEHQSVQGTLGEFVERYSAGCWSQAGLTRGTYNELTSHSTVLSYTKIRPYASWQYTNGFEYHKLKKTDTVSWIRAYNFTTQKETLVPAFLVFMPYADPVSNKKFIQNTSTGLAAHGSIEKATLSGFLECAERNAFSTFWYLQKKLSFIKYNAETVLKHFPDDAHIQHLYSNERIKICVYDLTKLSPIETIVVIVYFKYKNKMLQSIGTAARFYKRDALVKAMLEAYQGIEYAIMLNQKYKEEGGLHKNSIDSFSKHFAYYNFYPRTRHKVPLLKHSLRDDNFRKKLVFAKTKMKSFTRKELLKFNFKDVLAVHITPTDVNDVGYRVVRVIVPQWSMLTGVHNQPFLGNFQRAKREDLFLKYPHPFP